jgi:hypothetical protein
MSLQSCPQCGYAVAIAGGGCRHCASSSSAPALPHWREARLLLPLAAVAVALAILAYHIFFS